LTPDLRWGPVERATTVAGTVSYLVPLAEISSSLDGEYFTPMNFTRKYGRAWFDGYFDFTSIHNAGQELIFRIVDRAGNVVETKPNFIFDNSNAFAKIIHNVPREGDLVTGDFEISGLAYSDIGINAVYYRILSPINSWDSPEVTLSRRRDVPFIRLDTDQIYNGPLSIYNVTDGENILELYADDYYEIHGEVLRKVFRVSTAAPVTEVIEPLQNAWSRGNLLVRGNSFDLNGIGEISISMDNGVSYQRADVVSRQDRASDWHISINTRAYADGEYSMLIRSRDKYGVHSFTNALINIDNTPPLIDLGVPANGALVGTRLTINGQIYDNMGLKSVSYQLVNSGNPSIQLKSELSTAEVILEYVDVSMFQDGDYTFTIRVHDQAGNETIEIRNITLMLNRREYVDLDVNDYGVFSYKLPHGVLPDAGRVIFSAGFYTPSGDHVVSNENIVNINTFGPVLEIDSHNDGDVITKRPFISGRAYMVRPEEAARQEGRAVRASHSVSHVEISFDNGLSYERAKGTHNWRFRLETSELDMGTLPLLVRAHFYDGSIALRRIMLTVDTNVPTLNIIGPGENSAHRDEVRVFGSAQDDFDIDTVEVSLRPGNKFAYEVPGFIQGLYLDASFLGGLIWSSGIGLTFFDDNVKLQFNLSYAGASGRISNSGFGGKVLANIYNFNLSRLFGLDWEFWQTSFVLGAHFSYYLMDEIEDPQWWGQFLGQWEIIKADMGFFYPDWKYFKSISFYMEPGIWFAPSAADQSIDPNAWRVRFLIGLGMRISLF
jgi:hypothetical protein